MHVNYSRTRTLNKLKFAILKYTKIARCGPRTMARARVTYFVKVNFHGFHRLKNIFEIILAGYIYIKQLYCASKLFNLNIIIA